MEGSNLRPPRCERGALTTELTAPCLRDKVNYRHRHAHVQLRQRLCNAKRTYTNVTGKPAIKFQSAEDSNLSSQSDSQILTISKNLMVDVGTDSYLEVAAGVN